MKKVMVLGCRDSGTKNNPSLIAARMAAAGIDVEVCFWENLLFDVKTSDVNIFHKDRELFTDIKPDLVIALGWYKKGKEFFYRDVAYATGLYLQSHGVEIWNSEITQQTSTTKLSCLTKLALSDVPVTSSQYSIDRKLMQQPKAPFIAKSIAASRGQSNYLIQSAEQFDSLSVETPNKLMLQPFLTNDHDLRVICFGGEPSLVLRRSRVNADSHLNNTSQGGAAEWLSCETISSDILTESRKICKVLKRELGGIDFIPDSKSYFGYSCLEVNAIPQLSNGFDVPKKLDSMIEHIKKYPQRE